MPNIKSQIKRDKQNLKRAEKNKGAKSKIKTLSKNFKESIDGKDLQKAREELKSYYKTLDKAAKTKIIHKNFAANKKSKASKLLNSMSAATSDKEKK